ncbi:MAG: glycosyltransferase family 4 protein [Verrucomicrobiaceae bacterium]|nr:glycosyltransferase family 4 protein [Verrucomicrobiaceae bacterium]
MHIAHILRKYEPAQWGGTETAVLRLIQGLQTHGISSAVHAPKISALDASDPIRDIGAKVSRYHAFAPVLGISASQRAELTSWGGNLFSFDLFARLLQSKADVIHSHALNRIAGIGLRVARWKKIPHVVTLHGGALDIPSEVSEKLTAPLQGGFEWGKALGAFVQSRRVLELTDAIFTCNPREAQLLQQKYPQQRIIVQPHSVPAAQYAVDHRAAALKAFPQIAGRDLIVKVARLDPAKNLPWLVRQLPDLKRRHPKAMLVLIGAGTTQSVVEELHREIERLGLQNDVLLTGGLVSGSAELIGLIQQARVFALSSTAEPFGIVILEAWAAGTPVLSSRTSGPIALIDHGRTGLLYDLETPATFHQAIDAVFNDAHLHRHLREEARAHVLAEFDVPSIAARVARVYDGLHQPVARLSRAEKNVSRPTPNTSALAAKPRSESQATPNAIP